MVARRMRIATRGALLGLSRQVAVARLRLALSFGALWDGLSPTGRAPAAGPAGEAAHGASEPSYLTGGRERGPAPPRDLVSTWLILLVAFAMGFLAALALAAVNGADSLARSWTSELESRATIVIAPQSDAAEEAATLARALDAIRSTNDVISAEPLSSEEIASLLEPWLGADPSLVETMPLPVLIDVAVAPNRPTPTDALDDALQRAHVSAEIDAHGEWVDRLAPAADRIRLLAYAGLAIIGSAAALIIAIACAAALSAQRQVVSVLKLVGARDAFIAAMFMRRCQMLAFVGSAVGVGAAALLAIGAPLLAGGGPSGPELAPLTPDLAPNPWVWAQFAAAPLAFALIATAASWISVTAALQSAER